MEKAFLIMNINQSKNELLIIWFYSIMDLLIVIRSFIRNLLRIFLKLRHLLADSQNAMQALTRENIRDVICWATESSGVGWSTESLGLSDHFLPWKWSSRGNFDLGQGRSWNDGRRDTVATPTHRAIVSGRLLRVVSSADPLVRLASHVGLRLG